MYRYFHSVIRGGYCRTLMLQQTEIKLQAQSLLRSVLRLLILLRNVSVLFLYQDEP